MDALGNHNVKIALRRMMRVTSIPKDSMIIGESSQGVGPHLLPRVCLEALALSLIYIKLDLILTLSLSLIYQTWLDRPRGGGWWRWGGGWRPPSRLLSACSSGLKICWSELKSNADRLVPVKRDADMFLPVKSDADRLLGTTHHRGKLPQGRAWIPWGERTGKPFSD